MLPRNEQSNARRVASGDHLGEPAMQSPLVNWTRFEPSRLHDQIWSCPERADASAIVLPSGEKSGSISSRVDGATGVNAATPKFDWEARSRLYTFQSDLARWYASRTGAFADGRTNAG